MGNHGDNGETLKECLLQPLGAPWEQIMMLSSKSVQHFIRVIRVNTAMQRFLNTCSGVPDGCFLRAFPILMLTNLCRLFLLKAVF